MRGKKSPLPVGRPYKVSKIVSLQCQRSSVVLSTFTSIFAFRSFRPTPGLFLHLARKHTKNGASLDRCSKSDCPCCTADLRNHAPTLRRPRWSAPFRRPSASTCLAKSCTCARIYRALRSRFLPRSVGFQLQPSVVRGPARTVSRATPWL